MRKIWILFLLFIFSTLICLNKETVLADDDNTPAAVYSLLKEDCVWLYRHYGQAVNPYDANADKKISKEEALKAVDDWFGDKLELGKMIAILRFSKGNCLLGQNDPVSGTLSTQTKIVKLGDTFRIKVRGQDNNGMKALYLWGASIIKICSGENCSDVSSAPGWKKYDCPVNSKECQVEFEVKAENLGDYLFWGYVIGSKIDGTSESNWTRPRNINVKVQIPTPSPPQ